MTDETLITVGDVAALLNVPRSWVYAMAASGELPSMKVGSYRRFRRSEILAWLESRRHGTMVAAHGD